MLAKKAVKAKRQKLEPVEVATLLFGQMIHLGQLGLLDVQTARSAINLLKDDSHPVFSHLARILSSDLNAAGNAAATQIGIEIPQC